MKKYILDKNNVKLENIVFATTVGSCYEEDRLFLLENMPNTEFASFVLAEGSHCSCYDFDEVVWDCWELKLEELEKLLARPNLDKCRLYLKRYLKDN